MNDYQYKTVREIDKASNDGFREITTEQEAWYNRYADVRLTVPISIDRSINYELWYGPGKENFVPYIKDELMHELNNYLYGEIRDDLHKLMDVLHLKGEYDVLSMVLQIIRKTRSDGVSNDNNQER